ncbi:hypothetical protein BDZ94DRAFT_1301484 [Collybia nuda]|uniref:Fungal-type protein kinase domain-containing protein n=1 Tax=Collybia nuda TaxID=64659 RepID=A0A9P5XYL9_9AGAR|nr:hypothetical protein BDZ94DRAFT_1301484 [Collybia nuda]
MACPSSSHIPLFEYPRVSIQMSKNIRYRPQTPPNTTVPGTTSTPVRHHGSSCQAVSDAFKNLLVNSAAPVIAYDVENNEKTSVHEMLNFFLSQCATNNNNPAKQQHHEFTHLNHVLDAIMPICNKVETMDDVKEYCKEVEIEIDRYAPFVKLSNKILQKTATMKFPGLREPSLKILFHRSDPCDIKALHNGMETSRKPDVRDTDLTMAKDTASLEELNMPYVDFSMTSALVQPLRGFSWSDLLAVAEFKLRYKSCDDPPKKYGTSLTKKIKHVEDVRGPLYAAPADDTPQLPEKKSSTLLEKDPNLEPGIIKWLQQVQKQQQHPKRSAAETSADRTLTTIRSEDEAKKASKSPPPILVEKEISETMNTIPPVVQNAMYGTEILCRGPYASHAITLLILDDVVWIWWFDRQGAIQSAGINFVQDLPYFVVLLVVFQRFDFGHWGVLEEFWPHMIHSIPQFNVKFCTENIVVAAEPRADLYQRYSLTGRCTQVYTAIGALDKQYQPLSTNPLVLGELSSDSLALKMYWPEESRPNEAEILKRAFALGKTQDAIHDHIPELLASRDHVCSTGIIREWLGLKYAEEENNRYRILRILLFRKLKPLDPEQLPMKDFMRGWKQCLTCHFYLWEGGIEHGDISLGNLMWDSNKKKGVLADFDLATLRDNADKRGGERTGTVPFMALNLLTKEYFDGKITHLYRHDVESFVWILIWVCTRQNSEWSRNMWNTSNYDACHSSKFRFIFQGHLKVTRLEQDDLWGLVTALIGWVKSVNEVPAQGSQQCEPARGQVFKEVLKIVDDNWAWN